MNDTILIGPTQTLKTPDAIPASAHDVDYIIDPGRYSVSIRSVNWANVTVEAANDSQPPTLVNYQNHEYGLFQLVNGSATFNNLNVEFGGSRGVFAQTHNNASLVLSNLVLNAGCAYWGSGGCDVALKSVYSTGKPWKYFACNFNSPLRSFNFDNSKLPPMLQHLYQGPYEALVRLMQTGSGYLKNIVTVFATKQEIQLRSGGKFCLEDCAAHQVAVGWLEDKTIPPPPLPIQLVQFIGGSYDLYPDVSYTQKPARVAFMKTTIHGTSVTA